jgi:hypothetical protein
MKLLIMLFSPISHHFISLQTKYSPQQPVLKHTVFIGICQETKFRTHKMLPTYHLIILLDHCLKPLEEYKVLHKLQKNY